MIVCHCNAVSHTDIAEAARSARRPDGTLDMREVIARCHAGEGCGACTEVVVELAARAAASLSPLPV